MEDRKTKKDEKKAKKTERQNDKQTEREKYEMTEKQKGGMINRRNANKGLSIYYVIQIWGPERPPPLIVIL